VTEKLAPKAPKPKETKLLRVEDLSLNSNDFWTIHEEAWFFRALYRLAEEGNTEDLVDFLNHASKLSPGVARALAVIISGAALKQPTTDKGPFALRVQTIGRGAVGGSTLFQQDRGWDAFWEIKKRVDAGNKYTAAFGHVKKKSGLGATELRRVVEFWEYALDEKIPRAHRPTRTKKET